MTEPEFKSAIKAFSECYCAVKLSALGVVELTPDQQKATLATMFDAARSLGGTACTPAVMDYIMDEATAV